MFLNIKKISLDGYDFALKLLKKEFICVCPGNSFGPSGKSYVRINLGGNEKELYRGCEKIVKFAANF
jgi:aspartate/methionine/tyrosine aminotransferase